MKMEINEEKKDVLDNGRQIYEWGRTSEGFFLRRNKRLFCGASDK